MASHPKPALHPPKLDPDLRPPGAVIEAICCSRLDPQSWLAGSPVVHALDPLGIAHAGVISAPAPYRIVRNHLANAYFLATLSGAGRIYLEGKWRICRAGQAVLLMPGVLNAFASIPGEPWCHCWIRMQGDSKVSLGPIDRMQLISRWNPLPLKHAILGLRCAALVKSDPPLLEKWADLILSSVIAFSRCKNPDPRIVRLWDAVAADLARAWSLEEMARVAALSPEHLRRVSRAATGRSPRAHLVALRMQRATQLLKNPQVTLSQIADSVGYANSFAFSTAFKKAMGYPPSVFAGRTSPER